MKTSEQARKAAEVVVAWQALAGMHRIESTKSLEHIAGIIQTRAIDAATAEKEKDRDDWKKSAQQEARHRAEMVRTAKRVAYLEAKGDFKQEIAPLRAENARLRAIAKMIVMLTVKNPQTGAWEFQGHASFIESMVMGAKRATSVFREAAQAAKGET